MMNFISETWNKMETWQKILFVVGFIVLLPVIIWVLWQVLKFLALALMVVVGIIIIGFGGTALLNGEGGDFGGFE